jgi:histidine triad (HIT) family protein
MKNNNMENCIFCKIVKGDIPCVKIWEDEKYLSFLALNPVNPGHTLVIPKKHTDYIFDLSDSEYCELLQKAKNIAPTLKSKLNPKRVGMVVEGFEIPHVHVHLIPINKMNELNQCRLKPATAEELKKVAEKILK